MCERGLWCVRGGMVCWYGVYALCIIHTCIEREGEVCEQEAQEGLDLRRMGLIGSVHIERVGLIGLSYRGCGL
jgi:hypothetical protein